jgi:Na+-transporting methylmalonyl-CoA/oxaloacetate decarboxylase gamma subunit|tara:strand:- start:155 stop:433 length:279 start_codon:yes stop_codon:yes gene_type:complete
MDSIVITSLTVSLIAISVIFTVLVVLICTIKLLVYLLPYQEPPLSKSTTHASPQLSATNTVTPDIISAITAVMATHLGKSPQEFHITQINPK